MKGVTTVNGLPSYSTAELVPTAGASTIRIGVTLWGKGRRTELEDKKKAD